MNVFDVLREKLKQKKKISIDFSNGYRDTDKRLAIGYANKALAMGEAIEIVNQVEQEFTPKTNADRIRAMSDEQLADAMLKVNEIADYIPFCGSNEECSEIMGSGELIPPDMCKHCLMNWLGKEA